MRKLILLAAIAATVSGVSIAAAQSGATSPATDNSGSVLFQDYFNNAGDSNWTFYNRDGRIAEGRLWVDGSYQASGVDRDGWALTHLGDTSWRDYTFDVFYDNENATGSPPDRHMISAFFRVASEAGNVRQTMYRVDVWAAGDPYEGFGTCSDATNGFVTLGKYVNGTGHALAEACVSNTLPGTNALRVSFRGNTLAIVSNGMRVLSYTDPSPIKYGGVGVGQVWETNGWFDDVIVRSSEDQQ